MRLNQCIIKSDANGVGARRAEKAKTSLGNHQEVGSPRGFLAGPVEEY